MDRLHEENYSVWNGSTLTKFGDFARKKLSEQSLLSGFFPISNFPQNLFGTEPFDPRPLQQFFPLRPAPHFFATPRDPVTEQTFSQDLQAFAGAVLTPASSTRAPA